MTVVNPRSDQSSAGGFDDLYGLLCVQWGLKSKSSRNEAEILAAVVEPELLSYLSDVAYLTDVVVSKLFAFPSKGSIPLQMALDCTEAAINNSTIELPLPTDDLMDLLNICLTSTYFQHNGKHYKQLHGTA